MKHNQSSSRMEVNLERTHLIKGISLKRVLRLSCPRLRSSMFSPVFICLGLTSLILTHSLLHRRYGYNEEVTNNTTLKSIKSPLSVSNVILPINTTTATTSIIEDKKLHISENEHPYDWVKDDFFSPYKGKVVTKNERKYQPRAPLRFDKVLKSKPNNLSPYNITKSIFKGENKPVLHASAKSEETILQKEKYFQQKSNDKKKLPLGSVISGLAPLATFLMKNIGNSNNDDQHRSASFSDSLMGNIGPALLQSAIGSLSETTDKKNIGNLNNDRHKSASLADSLMENIGPVLLQSALGRLAAPTDKRDKSISTLESLMRNVGPSVLKGVMNGDMSNKASQNQPSGVESLMLNVGSSVLQGFMSGDISNKAGQNKPSGVESLMRNVGSSVLQGVMSGDMSNKAGHNQPSGVESLMRNVGSSVLQGVMSGDMSNKAAGQNQPSGVESLLRNVGSSVLQGVMRGEMTNKVNHNKPSGFVPLISKAAPKLLNGFLTEGKTRSEDIEKSHSKPREFSKKVTFADKPSR